jgi:hypothetical protein
MRREGEKGECGGQGDKERRKKNAAPARAERRSFIVVLEI